MPASLTVEFIHGLNQHPSVWQPVIDRLDAGIDAHASTLPGATAPRRKGSLLDGAARWVLAELADRSEEAGALVGHGVGALVAVRAARLEPGLVDRLVLSSPFARAPRRWMREQRELARWLPTEDAALTQRKLALAIEELASVDLRAELAALSVPTLVLAPKRERWMRRAAREVASLVPDARLDLVPDVPGEWNRTEPAEFAARIRPVFAPRE